MVAALFRPTRLLADAGVMLPASPIAAEREPVAMARHAALRLVEAFLAADDEPEAYRDVLWQLDAAQHYVDQMPPDTPDIRYLERILDALPLSGEGSAELRAGLAEYEAFLQHDARLEEALYVLALGALTHGPVLPASEFAERAFRAGRLNQLLARWGRASACYVAAAEAGRACDDEAMMLRSRLGRGGIYCAQGLLPAARAAAESVMREAGRQGLAEVEALAYWDLGVVLQLEGRLGEGLQAVYYAFQLCPDPEERWHALRDVGLALAALGAYDESRNAFETILESGADLLLRTGALIGLMSVESGVGNRVAFERWRDAADGLRGRMPPSLAVDYRYKLGIGLVRFGQRRSARRALDEALAIARRNRLHGWLRRLGISTQPLAHAG